MIYLGPWFNMPVPSNVLNHFLSNTYAHILTMSSERANCEKWEWNMLWVSEFQVYPQLSFV